MSAAPTARGATLLRVPGLVSLCAALVYGGLTPPRPAPATAPLPTFSALRALRHTAAIAQRPHPIGSADAARVRAYLRAELAAMGLAVDSQETTAIGTRYQAFGHVTTLLTRLPGSTPGGPAVLLLSHYDGVPAGPAASDAGSGVSVILETVRALRSAPPLRHDVIVALTDGEEAGLLGASAFVREHPWARDVAVTLNFEARGTTGRAVMFETGPGNLDLVRLLRHVPNASASSLAVTVYRQLNNDTDLSEIAQLGQPALNFAFAGGVERYHTTEDDVAHANAGAIQQEGDAAVRLVRALADGPLPRPLTRDAVFSDLPLLGIVFYDEAAARPVMLVLVLLFGVTTWRLRRRETRWLRHMALGVVMTVLAVTIAAVATFAAGQLAARVHASVGGAPGFRAVYALALALLAIAVATGCWALARRWAGTDGLHHGALLVWTALATWLSWRVPGASYLLVWPLPLVLVAAAVGPQRRARYEALVWGATVVACAVLVPITTLVCLVLVGVVGAGAIVMGVLVALLVVLLLPHWEWIGASRRARPALWAAAASVAAFAIGALTVRDTPAHPAPSMLAYATDADATDGRAWLVSPSAFAHRGPWFASVFGANAASVVLHDSAGADAPPAWLAGVFGDRTPIAARAVPRAADAAPTLTMLADSQSAAGRVVRVRVVTPGRALGTRVRVTGSAVRQAWVDGRLVGTTRFRHPQSEWSFTFAGPPDSGFVLQFVLPAGARPALELQAAWAGLPVLPGLAVPARPAGTIAAQNGDVRIVRRRVAL